MENKTLTPLSVLERYHKRYLEYEAAFNKEPFNDKDINERLKEIIDSGVDFDSEEFEDAVIDMMIEKPARRADVSNAALRFFLYTEFFLLTQEEELPAEIKKDFDNLPIAQDLKPFYSIKEGKFVRNEDTPINIDKNKLKDLYQAIKNS